MKEGQVSIVNIARVNRFWQLAWVRLQKVPKPKIRLRLNVITDELRYRSVCLTGEASTFVLLFDRRTNQKQAGRQGFVKRVEVADEPVVVIKSVPEKP